MKIAISGSAGVGKSTLGSTLAKHLNATFIQENYEPLNDAKIKGDFPPRILKIYEHKKSLETQFPHFVSDRCPFDLIQLWLNQSGHLIDEALTTRFVENAIQHAKHYDFIIIPPWNSIKLIQNNEPVGRNMNLMSQLKSHSGICGLIFMWCDKKKIIEIPQHITSIADRMEFVLRQMNAKRPELFNISNQ